MTSEIFLENFFVNSADPGNNFIMFDFYYAPVAGNAVDSFGNAISNGVKKITNNTLGDSWDSLTSITSGDVKKSFDNAVNAVGNVFKELKNTSTSTKNKKRKYVGSVIMPGINKASESLSQNFASEPGPIQHLLESSVIGDKAVKSVLKTVGLFNKASGAQELIVNADLNSVYSGGDLRKFEVSWEIIPKSIDEAEQVFKIIKTFKRAQAPEKSAGGVFLNGPMTVAIYFANKSLNDNLRYKEMVITSMNVNYSLSGFMEVFSDGNPKALSISISFSERRMLTREDWEDKEEVK